MWGGFSGGESILPVGEKLRAPSLPDTERSNFYLDAGEFIFIFRRNSIHLRYKIKHDMMTDPQRLMFREILDLNWEFEHSKDWTEKFELGKKLSAKKEELKASMGEPEYNHFINMGRQMFAPKR